MAVSDIPLSEILNQRTSYEQFLWYIPSRNKYRWDDRVDYCYTIGLIPVEGQGLPPAPPVPPLPSPFNQAQLSYLDLSFATRASITFKADLVNGLLPKSQLPALVKGDVGLGNVDNTSDANKPVSTAQRTALNLKADLVGGLVPTSQLPALAVMDSVVVASQAAMLALTTAQVQKGDLAVRTDGAGTFILTASDPSVLTNWQRLNAPTDVVLSVNGQTATVVLGKADVGLGNVDNTADSAKPVSTAQQAALDAKLSIAAAPNGTVFFKNGAGAVGGTAYSVAAAASSIALRGTDGTLTVATPTATGHATTKAYVDAAVAAGGGGGGGGTVDQVARDLAASKTRVWPIAAAPPSSNMATGDLFYRNDGTLFYYSGSAWVKINSATERYVQSRGLNLVTNGTFLLGDNTNWSAFAFDATDHPVGTAGMITSSVQTAGLSDELMPIDPSQTYEMAFYVKQLSGAANFYSAIAPYDADGLQISPAMYTSKTGTQTTLAAALNPGDTTITLTSAANWSPDTANSSTRYAAVGGHVDGKGYTWPAGVYTRNCPTYSSISGNVVTLSSAYTGPARAAGTPIWNSFAAGTYIYPNTNLPAPSDWTLFTGRVSGVTPAGAAATTNFPRPTSFVKLGFLSNYPPRTDPAKVGYSGITLTNVTGAAAAQAKADAAVPASAAGLGTVFAKSLGGDLGGIPYSASANADSIAQRTTGGALVVGTPTAASHAATKAYVDSNGGGAPLLVSVKSQGAVGDGVTDDTTPIRAAFDIVRAAGGGTVSFESGKTYIFNGVAYVGNNMLIDGNFATVKKAAGSQHQIFFTNQSAENATGYGAGARNVHFRNLRLSGDYTIPQASFRDGGTGFNHIDRLTFENCHFEQGMNNGHYIDLGGCSNVRILNCTFLGMRPQSGREYIEAIQVDVSTRQGTSWSPETLSSFDGLPTRGVLVDGCTFGPITVAGTTYPAPNPIGSHTVALEDDTGWYQDIKFVNNTIIDPMLAAATNNVYGAITIYGARGVDISGNTFINTISRRTATGKSTLINLVQATTAIPASQVQATSPTSTTLATPRQCQDVTIRGNRMIGFDNAPYLGDTGLFNLAYAKRVVVSANTSDGGSVSFVRADNLLESIVEANALYSTTADDAILIGNCQGVKIENNTVTMAAGSGTGIEIYRGRDVDLQGNTVFNGATAIRCNGLDNGTISSNYVRNYSINGFLIGESANTYTVFDMTLSNNRARTSTSGANALSIGTKSTRCMRYGNRWRDGGTVTDSGASTITAATDQTV